MLAKAKVTKMLVASEMLVDRVLAFPNAYLEVDEPPRHLPWGRILSLVGMLGTTFFGLTIIMLSFIDTEFSPITQAASDYGVGRYAVEMNLGFLIGGIGLIAFAFATLLEGTSRKPRAVPILFLVAGAVLIMDSYFTTNIEGGPSTFHGLIHGFGGLIFFIAAPIGALLSSRKFGRPIILPIFVILILGFVLLLGNINASGLAERIVLLGIFASVIYSSAHILKS